MISPKQDFIPFEKTSSIIFVLDKAEYSIERSYAEKSPYLKDLQPQYPPDQNIKITMPKWVSNSVFGIFYDFLKHSNLSFWSEKNIQIQDQTLQRLLWLGDFFQMDSFQDRVISELIVPRLDVSNCLLFLNESFKKLKACEESNDMWYMLLNSAMNYAAKNLIALYRKNSHDFLKVNPKILEEIIERSLKLSKGNQGEERMEILEILMKTRNATDIFELLQSLRKGISSRKLNGDNNSSISWKLSNLDSMINKETNTFKFYGLQWKLQAKMEDVASESVGSNASQQQQQEGKVLRIYLKLESNEQDKSDLTSEGDPLSAKDKFGGGASQQQNLSSLNQITSPTKASQDNNVGQKPTTAFSGLVTLYYQIYINDKEITSNINKIKHVVVGKTLRVVLCEFKAKELPSLGDKKIEFKVFMNTDQLYAAALSTITKNIDRYYKDKSLKLLLEDDLVAINKLASLLGTGKAEHAKCFGILSTRWVLQTAQIKDFAEIFRNIAYEEFLLEDLIRMAIIKKIHTDAETNKLFEDLIKKKSQGTINLNVERMGEFIPESMQAESDALVDGAYIASLTRNIQKDGQGKFIHESSAATSRSEKTLEDQQTPHRSRYMVSSYTADPTINNNDLPANKLDKLKRQTPSRSMIKSNLIENSTIRSKTNINSAGSIIDKENLTHVSMQPAWNMGQPGKPNPSIQLGQIISKPQNLSEKDIFIKEVFTDIDIRRFIKPNGVSLLRDLI